LPQQISYEIGGHTQTALYPIPRFIRSTVYNKTIRKNKIRMQFKGICTVLCHRDHYVLKSSKEINEPLMLRSGFFVNVFTTQPHFEI